LPADRFGRAVVAVDRSAVDLVFRFVDLELLATASH
jgi:hypothetical protein